MGPIYTDLPIGMRFRPSDFELAVYFLVKKALGHDMKARTVPEECDDIFSTHPRDLPGYGTEEHWYFYCRKHINQVTAAKSYHLWLPTGEETDVLDPKHKDVVLGIKRSFSFIENEEESDNNSLVDEDEPPQCNWFLDEISLPLTLIDTDWTLCHIFYKTIKPEFVNLPILESESEEDKEKEEDHESVDKPAESLDLVKEKDESVDKPEESLDYDKEKDESVDKPEESLDLVKEKDGNVDKPEESLDLVKEKDGNVDKPEESLDLVKEKDETVLPPP